MGAMRDKRSTNAALAGVFTRVREHSGQISNPLTSSPQPLPKHLKELGSSHLIKPEHTGTINMRVQHNLTIDLADPEIAEPSTAMDLAGDGNGTVVGAHDNLVL
jgi:hypothetical protein